MYKSAIIQFIGMVTVTQHAIQRHNYPESSESHTAIREFKFSELSTLEIIPVLVMLAMKLMHYKFLSGSLIFFTGGNLLSIGSCSRPSFKIQTHCIANTLLFQIPRRELIIKFVRACSINLSIRCSQKKGTLRPGKSSSWFSVVLFNGELPCNCIKESQEADRIILTESNLQELLCNPWVR